MPCLTCNKELPTSNLYFCNSTCQQFHTLGCKNEKDYEVLKDKIYNLLVDKKMSMAQIAEKVGFGVIHVSKICSVIVREKWRQQKQEEFEELAKEEFEIECIQSKMPNYFIPEWTETIGDLKKV